MLVGRPCPQRDFSVSTVGPILSVRKTLLYWDFYCLDFFFTYHIILNPNPQRVII